MITEKQKKLILDADVEDWHHIRKFLPTKYSRGCANHHRRRANLPELSGSRQIINEDFFKSRSEKSAYWAGFIAADGCIYRPPSLSSQLQIKLSEKDARHVEQFARSIGDRVTIIEREYRGFGSRGVRISSDTICKDLETLYNIKERKSLTLVPPDGLTKEENFAYIAGYIDGDGSYSAHGGRPRIRICGTKAVLEWMMGELGCKRASVRPSGNIFILRIDGDDAIRARATYIDKDLPFLERKYRYWEKNGVDLKIKNRVYRK